MIGLELKMLFTREINLLTITASLTDIQNRLNPVLVQHKDNEAKLITLKDRIFELSNATYTIYHRIEIFLKPLLAIGSDDFQSYLAI